MKFDKPKGPEKSEAENPEKKLDVPEGNEKALADAKKLIEAFKKKGVPVEQIPDLIAKETPKLQQELASNEKLTPEQKKMLDSLLHQYIEEKKQEVRGYLDDVQQKITSRATEVKHRILDYAKKGAKYGAIGAAAMNPAAVAGYGLSQGYQAVKESGRAEGRAEAAQKGEAVAANYKETLATLAKMPGKEGTDATRQLETIKALEENEKKLEIASFIADEYSETKLIGKENINRYIGSDLKGEYYDADQVRESAAGAIAAAYMLEGEDGAKRMRDSINEKEKKGRTESDAVQITDIQWSVNDYPGGAGKGAGMGGNLESYQEGYKRVNTASRTFATMYLSKAFTSEGFEDSKMFERYKKYVEGELQKTNEKLGEKNVRADEAHTEFMAHLQTPDQFLKIQGGVQEEKESSEEDAANIEQRRKDLEGLKLAHDSFQKSLNGNFSHEIGTLNIEGIPDEEVTDELVARARESLVNTMTAAYDEALNALNERAGTTSELLSAMTSATANRMAPSYYKIAKRLLGSFAGAPLLEEIQSPLSGDPEALAAAAMKMHNSDKTLTTWLEANKADLDTLQKWYGKNQKTVEKWEERGAGGPTKKGGVEKGPALAPAEKPTEKADDGKDKDDDKPVEEEKNPPVAATKPAEEPAKKVTVVLTASERKAAIKALNAFDQQQDSITTITIAGEKVVIIKRAPKGYSVAGEIYRGGQGAEDVLEAARKQAEKQKNATTRRG